jgi:hypothetical protein
LSLSAAQYQSSVNWTTSGSGTFANQTTLYPTYTPSAGDRAIGFVTLTMHVQGNAPCFNNEQDNMLLTINAGATANAGPDAQICTGTNFTVSAASATGNVAVTWSTTGTGTITGGNTLTPTYVPSAQDYLDGNVILTLSVIPAAPCTGNVSDEMMLTFINGPVANAGPDAEICFGINYTVTGASASGYLTINWTSTGSGTLVNANSLTPTYMPSNADRIAGSVNLIMTVQGAAPCFGSNSDVMTLTISSLPVVSGVVSGPQNVCAGQTGVNYSVTPVVNASGYNCFRKHFCECYFCLRKRTSFCCLPGYRKPIAWKSGNHHGPGNSVPKHFGCCLLNQRGYRRYSLSVDSTYRCNYCCRNRNQYHYCGLFNHSYFG